MREKLRPRGWAMGAGEGRGEVATEAVAVVVVVAVVGGGRWLDGEMALLILQIESIKRRGRRKGWYILAKQRQEPGGAERSTPWSPFLSPH